MRSFFSLLSRVLQAARAAFHPTSLLSVLGALLLCIGGIVLADHYMYEKYERSAKDQEREEYAYYLGQNMVVTFAGANGGCYVDKPWLVEASNSNTIDRDIAKLKVSVSFHRPNYAEPLPGFSSTFKMAANESTCINGPSWEKYPEVRVQALARKSYGHVVGRFIETAERLDATMAVESKIEPEGRAFVTKPSTPSVTVTDWNDRR